MDEQPDSTTSPDEKLLKEIRERHAYLTERWEKARKERATDMRYIMGDPWDPKDRKAREDAGRPCISHDELRQYINQAINNVRQNKRGIKVDPDGKGASDKTAEFRQDLIRTIEYKCGASSIYISAFEQAIRGSYGFFRITRRYVGKSFEQEIIIKPLLNPDSVLFDWDCKEADWSDAKDCFVFDPITKEEFKRKYPKAKIQDFTTEHMTQAPKWIQDKLVLVAEYWNLESKFSKRYQLADGTEVDEIPQGVKPEAEREYEEKTLTQYITNGVEIIKQIPQPGEIIPIIPVIGEEIWVDEGSGAERKLISLIRLARDPQLSLAYMVSQMMEEAGLSPKVPYKGYKGQFESARESWENCTKIPYAFLEADPMVDGATGAVLPLPVREPFTPNFGPSIIAQESCRRAVMSALGITPLPTAAQRSSEKSKVALDKIEQMQQGGSYHFVDNWDRALRLAGRVMDSWIPVAYDSQREMMLQKADDTFYKATLNTEVPYIDEKNQEAQYKTDQGSHHITISTGPSFQSQQDEVTQTLDLLIANLANLPIVPEQKAKLLARMIKMKEMGPGGDEMADIISPSQKDQPQLPPELIQQVQQMQQQLQALNEYAKQKEAELAEMKQKIDGQVVSNEYKLKITEMQNENKLAVAAMNNQTTSILERLKLMESFMEKLQGSEHEADMSERQHGHEKEMAKHNAEIAGRQSEVTQESQQTEET